MKKMPLITILTLIFLLLAVITVGVYLYNRLGLRTRDEKLQTLLIQLDTLPYLQGIHDAPERDGVTRRAEHGGLNLYVSNHAPSAFIMDMDGNELHSWHYTYKEAFAACDADDDTDTWHRKRHWTKYWRKVHLFDNGDLLAIFEGNGLIKIDKDSRLIWAVIGNFHHDLDVVDDRIYVLNRRIVTLPRFNRAKPVMEDLVTVLDMDGNHLEDISILEMFEKPAYAHLLEGIPPAGDIFHTNTLEILDGRHADRSPIFNRGNALISIRMLDTVAIADLDSKELVWAQKPGLWKTQHQPVLLDNGHILLFNNLYIKNVDDEQEMRYMRQTNGHILLKEKRYSDNMSSVIEFDPLSMEIVWEYTGTDGDTFFSLGSGSSQRLPGGNTLITESDRGRVFEVTPDGEIVWEYINTYRTGKKRKKISGIQDCIRYKTTDSPFLVSLGSDR